MIYPEHLRRYVIQPVLTKLGMESYAAENLLLVTAAAESAGGKYLCQICGPALGIYQMEPDTYQDVLDNYLHYSEEKTQKLKSIFPDFPRAEDELIGNLYYATAMARIYYTRFPELLPEACNLRALCEYYYKYWRPNPEKTSLEQVIEKVETNLRGDL